MSRPSGQLRLTSDVGAQQLFAPPGFPSRRWRERSNAPYWNKSFVVLAPSFPVTLTSTTFPWTASLTCKGILLFSFQLDSNVDLLDCTSEREHRLIAESTGFLGCQPQRKHGHSEANAVLGTDAENLPPAERLAESRQNLKDSLHSMNVSLKPILVVLNELKVAPWQFA
jgi:hypothetical protein